MIKYKFITTFQLIHLKITKLWNEYGTEMLQYLNHPNVINYLIVQNRITQCRQNEFLVIHLNHRLPTSKLLILISIFDFLYMIKLLTQAVILSYLSTLFNIHHKYLWKYLQKDQNLKVIQLSSDFRIRTIYIELFRICYTWS